MTTRTAVRHRRTLRMSGVVVAVVLVTYVLTYLGYALYLAAFADEGALPPRWRIPEVPDGAELVSETKECGSGGCWRQLVLRPEVGQTPDDLAGELGLTDTEHQGWRWYDPHTVDIGASVVGRDLHRYVRY